MTSDTRYARSADGTNIAFRVLPGSGPDLLVIPGWISNVDATYENPLSSRYHNELCRFARVVVFDKRGTGASDRFDPRQPPTLDRRLDDVAAVLAAAESDGAYVMGISEGGPLAILLAASHPNIVRGLILYGSFAHATFDLGWPSSVGRTIEEVAEIVEARWADGFPGLDVWAPSLEPFPEAHEAWQRFSRSAASPAAARAILELTFDIDARPLLEAIHVPTLVLHRRGDRAATLAMGDELARGIPDARLVVLDGDDHIPFVGDADAIVAEIEEFVTGTRTALVTDRSVATILFTDIVDSTSSVAALGDDRWSKVLEVHDATTQSVANAHGGTVIKSTGDGALIVFDRPARVLQCALDLVAALGSAGVPIRAGAHTGEIERPGDDVAGIAVHIASRVSSQAQRGEVLASRTVRDLVAGSPFVFDDRGDHTFKGIDEPWRLYAVHQPL